MKRKQVLIPLGLGAGALFLYLLLRPAKVKPPEPPEPVALQFIEKVADYYYSQYWGGHLPQWKASEISTSLNKWIEQRNLNLFTCLAIMAQEGVFNNYAIGPNGEKGLWQFTEIAIKDLEQVYGITIDRERLFEIEYNNELGTLRYFYCVILARGNRREAIARYHMTTEYWRAWGYADAVLLKRIHIADMYEEFIKIT